VSAGALGERFEVTQRTIYRDIEDLIAQGIPIESVTGPEGGYRLASDQPLSPLTLDSDEAMKLYVVSLFDRPRDDESSPAIEGSVSSRKRIKELAKRIYFDTSDWYWRDEGSGHLPTVRRALLTGVALKLISRVKGQQQSNTMIVKPYGLVWKAGEWHLVAEPIDKPLTRFRLNLVDNVATTDLRFTYPDDFHLQAWWADEMEEYGKGDIEVILRIEPEAREEMLRLTLKSTSKVESTPDGGLLIRLYVDRTEWLVPLVASYGPGVVVEAPAELRSEVISHHKAALSSYRTKAAPGTVHELPVYRNDDSRLRSTRGRARME
jgi:predicted DNA-binding transcriptional regulator YafY